MTNKLVPQFRRNKKFAKKRIRLATRVPAGTLVEFQYGTRKLNESGGWKNDPRPVLLVFYDDQENYIEGINTNYLNSTILRELLNAVRQAKGIENTLEGGKRLYELVKSVGPDTLIGYRKYNRHKITAAWKMEVDLVNEDI